MKGKNQDCMTIHNRQKRTRAGKRFFMCAAVTCSCYAKSIAFLQSQLLHDGKAKLVSDSNIRSLEKKNNC